MKINKQLFSTLLIILLLSFSLNIYLLYQNRERDRVVRVIDGDSFETSDHRRIRLLGIDAPEKDRCLYSEARQELKMLIEGKTVRLQNTVTDDYGRILANVFAGGNFVNKIMVQKGLAKFESVTSAHFQEMKEAANLAKSQNIGIYSGSCRRQIPVDNCIIKGNIRNKQRIYHLPGCPNYKETIVDEAYGDRWFCSENEATLAGFSKAMGCR